MQPGAFMLRMHWIASKIQNCSEWVDLFRTAFDSQNMKSFPLHCEGWLCEQAICAAWALIQSFPWISLAFQKRLPLKRHSIRMIDYEMRESRSRLDPIDREIQIYLCASLEIKHLFNLWCWQLSLRHERRQNKQCPVFFLLSFQNTIAEHFQSSSN